MVRSRNPVVVEQAEPLHVSSQSSSEGEMAELFEEILKLLQSSNLKGKKQKYIYRQLMEVAPNGYKEQVRAQKKQALKTPKFKGAAKKADALKKDSPFKSSYTARSSGTMPNSKKASVAKSMYGTMASDYLDLTSPA